VKDFKEDYAIFMLDRNIGNYTGMFGLKVHDSNDIGVDVATVLSNQSHFIGFVIHSNSSRWATAFFQGNLLNLTCLDLSENNIRDDGAISLSQGNLIISQIEFVL
jgi:hypothetical protein